MDQLTRDAITHTRHCLTGCGIGEVLGSVIGAWAAWSNAGQTALAVGLAFLFGYGLTFRGALSGGSPIKQAIKLALSIDTISIISMEIIDNVIIYLVPNAINSQVISWLFWWSLALSLAIAFVLTIPVNRLIMARSSHQHQTH